jgi:hypothetical protein
VKELLPDLDSDLLSRKRIFDASFDFHLIEPISKGKMSIIYEGVNLGNRRAIAVKFLQHRKPS